jgi:hypothetical protein
MPRARTMTSRRTRPLPKPPGGRRTHRCDVPVVPNLTVDSSVPSDCPLVRFLRSVRLSARPMVSRPSFRTLRRAVVGFDPLPGMKIFRTWQRPDRSRRRKIGGDSLRDAGMVRISWHRAPRKRCPTFVTLRSDASFTKVHLKISRLQVRKLFTFTRNMVARDTRNSRPHLRRSGSAYQKNRTAPSCRGTYHQF